MTLCDLVVRTLNARAWSGASMDGANAWMYRRSAVVASLQGIPIFGLQEMTLTAIHEVQISQPLLEAQFGQTIGEHYGFNPAFWDARRYALLNTCSFFLSYQEIRAATMVMLREKRKGRSIIIVNTHLDHKDAKDRALGALTIMRKLQEFAEGDTSIPVVIMGDFNSGPYRVSDKFPDKSAPSRLFRDAGFVDAYLSLPGRWPPPPTFHNFKGDNYAPDKYGTCYIDQIYIRGFEVVAATIDTQPVHNRLVSDHYSVTAHLNYAEET